MREVLISFVIALIVGSMVNGSKETQNAMQPSEAAIKPTQTDLPLREVNANDKRQIHYSHTNANDILPPMPANTRPSSGEPKGYNNTPDLKSIPSLGSSNQGHLPGVSNRNSNSFESSIKPNKTFTVTSDNDDSAKLRGTAK